jgi:hypothetical protein
MEQIVNIDQFIKGQRYNFRFFDGQHYNSLFTGYTVVEDRQDLLVLNTHLKKGLSYPKGIIDCPIRLTRPNIAKIYIYAFPTLPPDVNLLITDYVGYNG